MADGKEIEFFLASVGSFLSVLSLLSSPCISTFLSDPSLDDFSNSVRATLVLFLASSDLGADPLRSISSSPPNSNNV